MIHSAKRGNHDYAAACHAAEGLTIPQAGPTPEITQRLCDAIRDGNYGNVACGYAGIDIKRCRAWLARGKAATRGKFRLFYLAFQQAQKDHWQVLLAACRRWVASRKRGRKKWQGYLARMEAMAVRENI